MSAAAYFLLAILCADYAKRKMDERENLLAIVMIINSIFMLGFGLVEIFK